MNDPLSIRRHAPKLLACLLLGALISVLVAWIPELPSPSGVYYWHYEVRPVSDWSYSVPSGWGYPDEYYRGGKWSYSVESAIWNDTSTAPSHSGSLPSLHEITIKSCGFPFRLQSWRWERSGHLVHANDFGLIVSGTLRAESPLHWLWLGLILDTCVYAAVLWCSLLLFARFRRWQRARRKGLCPTCRYSLAGLPPGSPCPECGNIPVPNL